MLTILLKPACIAFFLQRTVLAQESLSTGTINNLTVAGNGTGLDSTGKVVLESGGIRAAFVSNGARLANVTSSPLPLVDQPPNTNSSG